MLEVPKHPEAKLYPSEVITLALLFAIKGGEMQAFYRWLTRDYLLLFPQVPERTREALPYPFLRRLSRPSQSRAALRRAAGLLGRKRRR